MALFIPKDRKSLFRQFLAGMYDAVVITDPNGHILEINPRTVEYFGREPEDVLDKPVSVFIPGLKQDVVARIRRGLEGDRHVVIDANAVTRDGVKIACEVAVSAIDLMNPGDLIFTIRNVERRREYMNAFRAKANAFQISQTALFCCGADGALCECNDTFLMMFGLKDLAEARTRRFSDFMNDDPLPENFRKALAGETTVTGIVAEGDGGDQEELEIILAPNVVGRKNNGVVGSVLKV
ncbi:MAG: PAS domain-containing protein [Kiritimatiellae bacterium]|nr:PAS domain-containing protein [Kiritimatiellia bacterium]